MNLTKCRYLRRRRQGQALGNRLLVYRRCPQLIGRLKNSLRHRQNESKKLRKIDDEHGVQMAVRSRTIRFMDESRTRIMCMYRSCTVEGRSEHTYSIAYDIQ